MRSGCALQQSIKKEMEMEDVKVLKRIQSRVLVEELSLEDYDRVSGGGCNTTYRGGCSGGSSGTNCGGGVDSECDF